MSYPKTDPRADFPVLEQQVLQYCRENNTFDKTLQKTIFTLPLFRADVNCFPPLFPLYMLFTFYVFRQGQKIPPKQRKTSCFEGVKQASKKNSQSQYLHSFLP